MYSVCVCIVCVYCVVISGHPITGYVNGFDGSFLFTTIGEGKRDNGINIKVPLSLLPLLSLFLSDFPSDVPYILMRSSSAVCGALLIPTVYEVGLA